MVKELAQSQGAVLGFEVMGKVSMEEEQKWIARLDEAIHQHGRLRVLVVLDENASWGIQSGIKDLKWILTHLKDIEKIAVVSSRTVWKWLVSLDGIFAPLVGIGEKHFDTSEIRAAWDWIQVPRP